VLVVGSVMFWYAVMMMDDARGRPAAVATIDAASFMVFRAPPSVSQNMSVDNKLLVGVMRNHIRFCNYFRQPLLYSAITCASHRLLHFFLADFDSNLSPDEASNMESNIAL